MRKIYKICALALVAALSLGFGPARAEVAVTIDQVEGDILFSLPGLPDPAPAYPVDTALTGTASFNNPGGAVGVLMTGPFGEKSGEAELSCDEAGTACTWSFTIPFFVAPGEYQVWVNAVDVDETVVYAPCNPNPEPEPEGTECVGLKVTVL